MDGRHEVAAVIRDHRVNLDRRLRECFLDDGTEFGDSLTGA